VEIQGRGHETESLLPHGRDHAHVLGHKAVRTDRDRPLIPDLITGHEAGERDRSQTHLGLKAKDKDMTLDPLQ
jgi:hypothetical protein